MESYTFFSFFRELIKSLLTPLSLFWLFLIAGYIFYLAGRKKITRWLIGSSLLWLFFISTPFLPKILLASLENQYPPIHLLTGVSNSVLANDSNVHVLVLGSGYVPDDRLSYSNQLSSAGLARLTEGMRMQRSFPFSKLIFSGNAGTQPLPTAEINSLAAKELGIDSTVISTLCEPWNTKTEALEYLKRYGTAYKLYLVTDAAHMPRAVMHFRHAGLNPIPAPTNFMIRKNKILYRYIDYFPSSDYILWMEIASKEYLGMLWAKMGGN